MERRHLIAGVGAAFVALAVPKGRAFATSPPPPPSRELEESYAKIKALSQFVGAWEGDEVFNAPGEGNTRTSIYRQLIRPGGQDFILSVYYRNNHLTSVDAIIYSPQDGEYRFIQPGVRYTPRSDTEVPIKLQDLDRLEWKTSLDGASEQTVVKLFGDEWHEQRVLLATNGATFTSRAVLKRTPTQRWVVPN